MAKHSDLTIKETISVLGIFILILAGALFSIQFKSSSQSSLSIWTESMGIFLSGVGTFGIFILALLRLPEEMKKWRNQRKEEYRLRRKDRLDEKKEVAAAMCLEAVDRVCGAISFIGNPFSYMGEGMNQEEFEKWKEEQDGEKYSPKRKGELESELFSKMLNSRYERVSDDLKFFYSALIQANVYFDGEVVEGLKEIQAILNELRVSGSMHARGLVEDRNGRIKAYRDAYNDFYDIKNKRKNKLEDVKNKIIKLLKSYLIHS